jgi:hypothetical protein
LHPAVEILANIRFRFPIAGSASVTDSVKVTQAHLESSGLISEADLAEALFSAEPGTDGIGLRMPRRG